MLYQIAKNFAKKIVSECLGLTATPAGALFFLGMFILFRKNKSFQMLLFSVTLFVGGPYLVEKAPEWYAKAQTTAERLQAQAAQAVEQVGKKIAQKARKQRYLTEKIPTQQQATTLLVQVKDRAAQAVEQAGKKVTKKARKHRRRLTKKRYKKRATRLIWEGVRNPLRLIVHYIIIPLIIWWLFRMLLRDVARLIGRRGHGDQFAFKEEPASHQTALLCTQAKLDEESMPNPDDVGVGASGLSHTIPLVAGQRKEIRITPPQLLHALAEIYEIPPAWRPRFVVATQALEHAIAHGQMPPRALHLFLEAKGNLLLPGKQAASCGLAEESLSHQMRALDRQGRIRQRQLERQMERQQQREAQRAVRQAQRAQEREKERQQRQRERARHEEEVRGRREAEEVKRMYQAEDIRAREAQRAARQAQRAQEREEERQQRQRERARHEEEVCGRREAEKVRIRREEEQVRQAAGIRAREAQHAVRQAQRAQEHEEGRQRHRDRMQRAMQQNQGTQRWREERQRRGRARREAEQVRQAAEEARAREVQGAAQQVREVIDPQAEEGALAPDDEGQELMATEELDQGHGHGGQLHGGNEEDPSLAQGGEDDGLGGGTLFNFSDFSGALGGFIPNISSVSTAAAEAAARNSWQVQEAFKVAAEASTELYAAQAIGKVSEGVVHHMPLPLPVPGLPIPISLLPVSNPILKATAEMNKATIEQAAS